MNKLLAYTYSDDQLIIQQYLLLQHRGMKIDSVAYIKGDGGEVSKTIKDFWQHEKTEISLTYLPQLSTVENEDDYQKIESSLYKWYVNESNGCDCYVWIGGGHKLYSAALQKCAMLFGASQVFHVLVYKKQFPNDIESINRAIDAGVIQYVSIGAMPGWPALRKIPMDDLYYERINQIASAVSKRNVEAINEYPFECINILPPAAVEWLKQPLEKSDYNWILRLPKIELHCHLGGFATQDNDLLYIRSKAKRTLPEIKNIPYPEGWPKPSETIDLLDYMNLGDNNGSYILKDEGCLEAHVKLLYQHFVNQRIVYAEVRCSPYNYSSSFNNADEILDIIIRSFNACMQFSLKEDTHLCHVNLIIIATRKPGGNKESIKKHIQLAALNGEESNHRGTCQVVGVDLAGYEHEETRGSYFEEDFEPIHRAGVAITVHAGENDNAEAIWEAVFKLNTRRIGHGLRLQEDMKLLRSVVNRKIGIEMCPYANFQIRGFRPMPGVQESYPLQTYLDQGVQVCINTDNIGISKASITDNFILLTELCRGISRMDVLKLIRNGMEQAFVTYKLRQELIERANYELFHLMLNRPVVS